MEQVQQLSAFFKAIEGDGRIAPMHICVYAALLHYWSQHQYAVPIRVFSTDIMKIAKLMNRGTYLKYMADLSEYGYIRYEPSRKKNAASKVHLISVCDF